MRLSAHAVVIDDGVLAAVATPPARAAPATNATITLRFFMVEILPQLPEIFLLCLPEEFEDYETYGSLTWIRTKNLPINSRLLCR